MKMALKFILTLLMCANSIQIGHSQQESSHSEAPFLIGYVQQLQTYVVNVFAPPKESPGKLEALVEWRNVGIGEPPYMVADLTGERLCFAQTSKLNLTCMEWFESGKVEGRTYPAPSPSKIISINFPEPRTTDYEVVYTTRKQVNGKSVVAIKLFDSKSNSSVTIHHGENIYEENIAVDTNSWFVFFEDVKHDKIWYVDLIQGKTSEIPQKTEKTAKDNLRNNTIAVDIKAGVLYNMLLKSVFSWRYLNKTIPKFEFYVYENEPESHLSLSADDKLFYTLQGSRNNVSLVSQKGKDYFRQYFPKQPRNSTLFFGKAIFRNQNKTSLDTSCPRFCRLNKNKKCVCWCPVEKPLLTLNKECKPLVVLTAENSGTKVLLTKTQPQKRWNWLQNYTFRINPIAYNALENRLCQPKLNTETNTTGLWCYYTDPGKGRWVSSKNVLYPVNQAANTSDIYWMAEAKNETQSLWALENGIAKNMKVYAKDPQHVAVDSFRQILFWCTEILGNVHVQWQAFNRTGKKPDCFQRQISKATNCNGLAVSEVQTKVFILSQNTVYEATYKELQEERDVQNSLVTFSTSISRLVGNITGFSYHSGNLIWFNPAIKQPNVVILQAFDDGNDKDRKPAKVIELKKSVVQIQALMPHSEVFETTDQCESLPAGFAGICNGLGTDGPNPPETCTLVMDPPNTTTEPTITSTTSTTRATTQAPSSPSTSLETTKFDNNSTTAENSTTSTTLKTTTLAPKTTETITSERAKYPVTTSTLKPETTPQKSTSPTSHTTEVTDSTERSSTPMLDPAPEVKIAGAVSTTAIPDYDLDPTNGTSSGTTESTPIPTQPTVASSPQLPVDVTTLKPTTKYETSTPKFTIPEPVKPSVESPPTEVPTSLGTSTSTSTEEARTTTSEPIPIQPRIATIPPIRSPDPPGNPQTRIPPPKIDSPSTPESTSSAGLEAVPIILALLAIFCVAAAFFIFRRYQQKKSACANAISIFLNGSEGLLEAARDTAERSLYIPFASIISTNHVVVEHFKHLRDGAFSVACLGVHAGNDVVVETLKHSLDIATFKFLLHNLKLLVHIGQHNHVIEFFGAEISAIQTGIISAVLEHSLQGPLTNVLNEMRRNLGTDNETGASNRQDAVPNLMAWSSQIAQGLQHLWSKNIVHGSLCVRNVRVTDNNIVKISVFGHVQTQFAQPKSGTSIKVIDASNFRWAAPETLQRSEYSFKSDVWSYGVTVWEIFSFGLVPYGDQQEYNPAFVNEVALGELRLQKPQLMTEDIYNYILVPCWRTAPSDRSAVAQINESWQQRLDRLK